MDVSNSETPAQVDKLFPYSANCNILAIMFDPATCHVGFELVRTIFNGDESDEKSH